MSHYRLTVVTPTQQLVVRAPAQQPLTTTTDRTEVTVAPVRHPLTVTTQQQQLTLAAGVPGPPGPPGPPGAPGTVDWYLHEQAAPAATWIVNHQLGRYPQVSLIDPTGELVEADVHYGDTNTVTVVFAQAATGKAALI